MAYVCLDGLKISGVNIVGVIGAKKNHPTYNDFKDFVLARGLNFIEYDSLKDEKFLETIRDLNADIAVVSSFNYKITKALLDCVKDGFINIHPSLLPDYRGKNPYSSVIINDEKQTGVTLHFMDEEFDTGDIIIQEKMPIHSRETMGTLFNRLNFLGFEMVLRTLKKYEVAAIPRRKQPVKPTIEAGSFTERELFIDFNKPVLDIERFVRALNPFLGASSIFRNTVVKIYAVNAIKGKFDDGNSVGTIVKIDEDGFYIKAKDGLIAPTVIQFGSFFTGTARDFVEILNPKLGDKFGEQ